jgi:single-strand DNA-binding protein
MNDTVVTIVGNALTMPEWRRLERTGTLVTHFKVASSSRRFDRENKRWVDGDSLRVRVNCWRRLAEGVAASVKVGDPVIVTGRMYTRDWTTPEGQRRVMYELDAAAVGHDLARGRGVFERNRPTLTTSVVEDAETDGRIRGEQSESVTELNERREQVDEFHNDDDPLGPTADFDVTPPPLSMPDDPEVDGAVADLDDVLTGGVEAALADLDGSAAEVAEAVPAAPVGPSGRDGRRRSRVPVGA